MGKLIVVQFETLHDIQKTTFYRIIGRVLHYDSDRGIARIQSLFDNSECEVELDFEQSKPFVLYSKMVIDMSVVTVISFFTKEWVLKEITMSVIEMPSYLIDSKEILLKFAKD